MRDLLSAALSLCQAILLVFAGGVTPAHAFEIESFTRFAAPQPGAFELRVISTADTELFTPIILSFQEANPRITIDYTTISSAQLMQAITGEGAVFDVAISSAMDLQTKLANDGFTQPHRSGATELLPPWAKWRDHVFAFTQEPAAVVISPAAFEGLNVPRNREDIIALLRAYPERFRGRIGTYDVRKSGLGYLFATQDSRQSETFWRLAEVMGSLNARLYCCSSDMIEDVASGRIALAYNVLGSYAAARTDLAGQRRIIEPQDFTTVMLRSALIPASAPNPELAGHFIDHLIRLSWGKADPASYPFPPIIPDPAAGNNPSLRPIRLGPGLLVYLDDLKRQHFLRAWEAAMVRL